MNMKDELENFIQLNRDGFDRENPDPAVLGRILAQMGGQDKNQARGIVIPFRVLPWAAACLVIIAAGVAFLILQKKQVNTALVSNKGITNRRVQPATPPTVLAQNKPAGSQSLNKIDNDLSARKKALLVKLTEPGSPSKNLVWTTGLKNMDSPASRIAAISEAFNQQNAGNDVVDALVATLNNDPNTNVRLAALDGLTQYYRETYVRKQLIGSLKKQQDPVVQIALIELLTRMRESAILAELDRMVNDENTMKAVKDCAYSGIFQLRSS
jgi:hypothetical protein